MGLVVVEKALYNQKRVNKQTKITRKQVSQSLEEEQQEMVLIVPGNSYFPHSSIRSIYMRTCERVANDNIIHMAIE